jgi:hypothetical protein
MTEDKEENKNEQLETKSNQDITIQTVQNTDSMRGHINFWADLEKVFVYRY